MATSYIISAWVPGWFRSQVLGALRTYLANGALSGTRTHTLRSLKPLTLPIGLPEHVCG